MSEIKITCPCRVCENKIKNVRELHFGDGYIQLLLECDHSVVIKSEPLPEPRSGRFWLDKDGENVINTAVAFIDQLNSFNSFLHPEVLKRAKELQNAVAYYWQKGYWKDKRDIAFVALNANEFAKWLKTHPEPAEAQTFKENTFTSFHRCEWCGEEIVHEPVTIGNYKDFTVVCAKCLQWKREGGKVIITGLKNVRPGPIPLTDECKTEKNTHPDCHQYDSRFCDPKSTHSIRHVNPNCHDSRFCNPHPEDGPVEYDINKIFAYLKALENASGKYLTGYDNGQITLSAGEHQ